MSRLSLNQRFWIFAIVLAVGTLVLAGQMGWHNVQDHRRHVRSIELMGAFHSVIDAGDQILEESAAADALMGIPPGRRPGLEADLESARRRTDATVATMEARVRALREADPDIVDAGVRATHLNVDRARSAVDELLSMPVGERTRQAVEAAVAAEGRAIAATTPLLDHVAAEVIVNDAGRAGGVNTPRLQVYLRDSTNRKIAIFIPALTTGTRVTPVEVRDFRVARVSTGQIEQVLRRLLLVDPGDTQLRALLVSLQTQAGARARATFDDLVERSDSGRPYGMTTAGYMARMVPLTSGLDAVGDLTSDHTLELSRKARDSAYRSMWLSLIISTATIGLLAGALVLTRRSIFRPLSSARASILALARGEDPPPRPTLGRFVSRDVTELFAAIDGLRDKERRRMVLEDERAAVQAQLQHEAATDGLTGLFNRRTVDSVGLGWASGAGEQASQVMAVMLVDVDHFKAINDSHGHLVGDRVLQIVAARLKAGLRSGDMVARFGGEEFLILVADVSDDEVMAMAEGLRRTIEDDHVATGDGTTIPVRVSIGVARAERGSCTWPDIIAAADTALYRAKAGGRNRAEAAAVTGTSRPSAGER